MPQTSLNGTTIAHRKGQFSHSRVKTDTSASCCLFFFFASPHGVFYISPKNRLTERCPKECVYKLPNTPTHALKHTHTHTRTHTHARQQCSCPFSSQQVILSVSVRHTTSSQPRRGTFGSSFSGKNKIKQKQNKTKKKKVGSFFFSYFVSLSPNKEFNLEFLPGTKTSQQVKVPSLDFLFYSIHLAA